MRFTFRPSRHILIMLALLPILAFGQGKSKYKTPYAFTSLTGLASIGTRDGSAESAQFNDPSSVVVDSSGNMYIADTANCTIRKVSTSGVTTTLAGASGVAGTADGTGTAARFNWPAGMVIDSSGTLYVADTANHSIRKVTSAGVVTTLAGNSGTYGFADGTGTAAKFNQPLGLVLDSSSNLYVADTGNSIIRKVTPAGVVTTFVGTGTQPSAGSIDGTGNAARFYLPNGVVSDTSGNVFVADSYNHTIRKVTSAGVVTTFAGSAGQRGTTDGTGTAARFDLPCHMAIDSSNNIYVADSINSTIRKITSAGVVTTFAGMAGTPGYVDGNTSGALFNGPAAVAVDTSGNLFIADTGNNTIRKISSAGLVTTIAGQAGISGVTDDTGTAALFASPTGICVDTSGNLFVADASVHTIRKITSAGVVTTFAGEAGYYGITDASSTAARFYTPEDVAVDSSGNVYVADTNNCLIRKITSAGAVSTIAGMARRKGAVDGTGTATQFCFPAGLTIDSSGNLFVADTYNNMIRKITSSAVVSTLAGAASNAGYLDGTGTAVKFRNAAGITLNTDGNFYVADTGNNTIRKVTAAGVVTAYAGAGYTASSGSTDGALRTARFNSPGAITSDNQGNLYVADTSSSTVRKIDNNNTVSTLVGVAYTPGLADGTTTSARLNLPNGISSDTSGYLYVADSGNNVIRRVVASTGATTTIAGLASSRGSTDGTGSAARFYEPIGCAYDSTTGNLYVTDTNNNTIRQVTSAGVVTSIAGTAGVTGIADGTGTSGTFYGPSGIAVDSSGVMYVADTNSSIIRKVTSAGVVTTMAGIAATTGTADGSTTDARFNSPIGIAVSSSGTVYIADSGSHTIRKMTSGGVVTTLAGKAGTSGCEDATGTGATFYSPQALVTDSSENIYVSDTANNTIRKVTSSGVVTTFAGNAYQKGHVDATGTFAYFNSPRGITADSSGNIYVADTNSHIIRKITSAGVVTTYAGIAGSTGYNDGTLTTARFSLPHGLSSDSSGNIYVSDSGNNIIRKVASDGTVTTLAGLASTASTGNADGTLTQARFNEPHAVAVDTSGNIYVGDTYNATVRKITTGGEVTTLAGVAGTTGSENGQGLIAQFYYPYGLALDTSGNVYVADTFNATIRKITSEGVVSTLAGLAGSRGSTDDTGSSAYFYAPRGVAVDTSGNVYVADWGNHNIRKVTPTGVVSTFAGDAGYSGHIDAAGTSARFSSPVGLTIDPAGNLYVAEIGNNDVRKVTPSGVVTTLAGSTLNSGIEDGMSAGAWFYEPSGVTVDTSGTVFVADTGNHLIRKITSAGVVTTVGGLANVAGSTDGTGSAALFYSPAGIAIDSSGNLFVADTINNKIRKGVPTTTDSDSSGTSGSSGSSSTSSSSGSSSSSSGSSSSSSGSSTSTSYTGSPNSSTGIALFLYPTGLALDSSNNLYVADPSAHTIYKVNTSSVVSSYAGMAGVAGTTDATGTDARFNQPHGVAVDSSGNVYVTDTGNAMIRKIATDRAVTTFAGATASRGNQDGTGTSAWFSSPIGISVDSSNNLYVADCYTETVRKITSSAVVSTVAGAAAARGEADGTGTAARFNYPTGVASPANGNLYIADAYNDTIRKITSAGVVSTIAGSAGISGTYDGTGSYSLFNQPIGVTADSSGNIYVADTVNCTIRKITSAGVVTTVAGMAGIAGYRDGSGSTALFNQPRGVLLDSSGNLYVADSGNAAIRKVASDGTVTTPSMTQEVITTTTTTSSGGGAFEAWFAAGFALLMAARWNRRRTG